MLKKSSPNNGLADIAERLLRVPPNETISPFNTALPNKPCLKITGLALITIPFLWGAIVTFFASTTLDFLTLTISPIPAFAFLLIKPSILIMFKPISPGYALSVIATVFLSP